MAASIAKTKSKSSTRTKKGSSKGRVARMASASKAPPKGGKKGSRKLRARK